jgi:cytochrome P450
LGPRNCVGQPLAHIILRVLLSRIIHRFRIRDERVEEKGGGEDATNLRREMQAGFTVLPQGGVSLSFHDRAVQEI